MSEHVGTRLSIPSDHTEDHRVAVTFCKGFDCKNPVTTHRVRQNKHGHREYCSLLCYARWPPEMRHAIAKFPEYEQSPSGLEALLRDLKKEYGIEGTAEKLGLSRSTISYWLRKLVMFRNFAGQSTETILRMLYDVAQLQGPEYAAALVDVSPVTLLRSFERLETDQQPERAAA